MEWSKTQLHGPSKSLPQGHIQRILCMLVDSTSLLEQAGLRTVLSENKELVYTLERRWLKSLCSKRENTLRILGIDWAYPGSQWAEEESLLSLWEQVKGPRRSNLKGGERSSLEVDEILSASLGCMSVALLGRIWRLNGTLRKRGSPRHSLLHQHETWNHNLEYTSSECSCQACQQS